MSFKRFLTAYIKRLFTAKRRVKLPYLTHVPEAPVILAAVVVSGEILMRLLLLTVVVGNLKLIFLQLHTFSVIHFRFYDCINSLHKFKGLSSVERHLFRFKETKHISHLKLEDR